MFINNKTSSTSMRLFLALMLFAAFCNAGLIYGNIYSEDLNSLESAVITIEGDFSYQIVIQKSHYSFNLPNGKYNITAKSGELESANHVKIGDEEQNIDLVLRRKQDYYWLLAPVIVLSIVLFFVLIHKPNEKIQETSKPKTKEEYTPDQESKLVLKILSEHENRLTQKELKELTKFSDSKLSLILTELENYGLVKRFKRGRGNVIKKIKEL